MMNMKDMSPTLRMIEILKILHELSLEEYEVLSLGAQFDTNLVISERVEKIISFVENNYQNRISSDQNTKLQAQVSYFNDNLNEIIFNCTYNSA